MASDKIVVDDKFIAEVRGKLNEYATTLQTMYLGTLPLLNNVKVAAGAPGYQEGDSLSAAVSTAGGQLHTRLDGLKKGLDLQVKRLDRMLSEMDEIEALNTRAPSSINLYLDPAFVTSRSAL